MMAMTTYVIFGIDMETDIGNYLKSYNGVRQGTSRIFDILERFSIPATFFFTGETARDNPETVKAVVRKGHEARLVINKKIVGDIAGLQPVSFRAPRRWQGQAQIEALEKHGRLIFRAHRADEWRGFPVRHLPGFLSGVADP
jgi:hypothetical protein